MTVASERLWALLLSLWLRLTTVAVIGLVFALALTWPDAIAAWLYYMTGWEAAFEMAVRVIVRALVGVALGSVCTAALAPFLLYYKSSRDRLAEAATRSAVGIAAFVDFAIALRASCHWAGIWRLGSVFACYCLAFAVVLFIPRLREQLLTSLDPFLGEKATRRFLIKVAIGTTALIAGEWAMGHAATGVRPVLAAVRPSGPNILLITFDALSAEDMSLYGYRLPTTPHIDEFARKSSVFTSFFSASTFTTPSIATILTGLHPSEHQVYHLSGRLSAKNSLPHLMRAGGYRTGASVSNPFAFFLNEGLAAEYDAFPSMPYRSGGGFMKLWDATGILHQHQPYGSRYDEFGDLQEAWDFLPFLLETCNPRLFGRTDSTFPPGESFVQAQELLNRLSGGFFLWVHVFAPHAPYLPDARNLGRFLPSPEMRTEVEQGSVTAWERYKPGKQPLVDKARLRYDEFVAETDDAFGAFLSRLEANGRLRNTAVIVTADHGESFEGGVYTHKSRYQTRPEIHIPLIIRMPGQEQGHRVEFTADQSALVPTMLDIAGLPRLDSMHSQSLFPWLNRDNAGEGEGLAFTQYLETNSVFKPLSSGTIGVIDGQHQYVLDLGTGKGILRNLSEAQVADLDRSAEAPALAQTLRGVIFARFPSSPAQRRVNRQYLNLTAGACLTRGPQWNPAPPARPTNPH